MLSRHHKHWISIWQTLCGPVGLAGNHIMIYRVPVSARMCIIRKQTQKRCATLQRRTAVTAYLKSKQLLLFVFARRSGDGDFSPTFLILFLRCILGSGFVYPLCFLSISAANPCLRLSQWIPVTIMTVRMLDLRRSSQAAVRVLSTYMYHIYF